MPGAELQHVASQQNCQSGWPLSSCCSSIEVQRHKSYIPLATRQKAHYSPKIIGLSVQSMHSFLMEEKVRQLIMSCQAQAG